MGNVSKNSTSGSIPVKEAEENLIPGETEHFYILPGKSRGIMLIL